jgi:hypothetical protein
VIVPQVGANGIRPPENLPVGEWMAIELSGLQETIGAVDEAIGIVDGAIEQEAKYQGECHSPYRGLFRDDIYSDVNPAIDYSDNLCKIAATLSCKSGTMVSTIDQTVPNSIRQY